MLFMQHSPCIPVPRVYALFKDSTDRKVYIIMERLHGNTLDSDWSSLSEAQKNTVTVKLKAYVDEMRKLSSPGGYCSVGNRALLDTFFWTGDTIDTISRSFRTEAELNDAMAEKFLFNNLPPTKADFFKRAFPSVLRDHPPVFTHCDLQRKKVMVRKVSSSDENGQEGEEYQITIIDWESAGWYPSYLEFSRALYACGRWKDDWSLWAEKILDPFLNEWAWMETLLRELWS